MQGALGHGITLASGLAAQNSTVNSTYQSQMAAQNSIIGTNATTGFTVAQPIFQEGQHIFNCQKVENGWTLQYRSKQYIAADLDSLMDQMKAAMVMERIEK